MNISKFFHASIRLITLCSTITLLSGCAHQISSDIYSENSVTEVSEAYQGVVIDVRVVRVENADNITGMVIGGVTGGILGNQIGKGSGNAITTTAGALLGLAIGASVEKDLSSQDAYEYVVQLNTGEIKVIIQGMDNLLNPGQPVFLIVGYQGRPRLIPDNSAVISQSLEGASI